MLAMYYSGIYFFGGIQLFCEEHFKGWTVNRSKQGNSFVTSSFEEEFWRRDEFCGPGNRGKVSCLGLYLIKTAGRWYYA